MTESVCPLLIWSHLLPCTYAVSGVIMPTVSAIRRRKKQGWKEVALYPRLARRERNRSTNCCSGTSLLLDSITLHLRAGASLFIRGLRMCADSTCPLNSLLPYRLWPAGRGVQKKKKLQFPALEATQNSHVLSRWTRTTWPASLGWPSGPAGGTLEGSLACPADATRTDYLVYCSQRA